MSDTIVWITGASGGIGAALAAAVPFADARVFDISRSGGSAAEHVPADLSDPSSWAAVEAHLSAQMGQFTGSRAVFVHNAATLSPTGFMGEVDSEGYRRQSVLNSAAPQALGHAFLRAVAGFQGQTHLVMLTSGAARSPYPGWSGYCAGKAAVDMWCRVAGQEQDLRAQEDSRPACRVMAVAPGVVATEMQEFIRATDERDFPRVERFKEYHETGQLEDPDDVARRIWALLDRDIPNGSVLDLRDLD